MNNKENKFRQQLIDYIKANDEYFAMTNMDNYGLTLLTIIKTNLEINIANSKRKPKRNNQCGTRRKINGNAQKD